MSKAIATGISHKSPLKLLVPFPFFLDVVFQTFPVVHLPEKEGGFWNSVNLSHDDTATNLGTGGTHGLGSLIVLTILKAGVENSVVAALFFRDFGA